MCSNLDKSFNDLVTAIESDGEIKKKAITYIETKNIGIRNTAILSKNLDKEIETLSRINDIESIDELNEPDNFEVDVPDFDKRITESHLSSFDRQYNQKQAKKDLVNIVSGFSGSEYMPLAVDKFTLDDTSDEFTKKETLKARYRTPEGKYLSF